MKDDPVVIEPALQERFDYAMKRHRVILFSAPCGCGKTTTARALLRGRAFDGRDGAEGFSADCPVPFGCEAVLIDNLQLLVDEAGRQCLVRMINEREDLRFVLLSRGTIPGWLMSFQLSGMMETFRIDDLLLGLEASRQMVEADGVHLSAADMADVQRAVKGYALGLRFLRAHLEAGEPYGSNAIEAARRDIFNYFDEAVYRKLERPVRNLLLCMAPFECFTVAMAKAMSGEDVAGEIIAQLEKTTTMLVIDGADTYRFRDIFKQFLLWEAAREYTPADERALYGRAGLYYEMQGDVVNALECYTRNGDGRRVSELLERHAKLHPGVGHYYETERFYRALPEREVLRSPALMCGMSMLCALTLDFEGSESWYARLQEYAAGLSKSDAEFREARTRIAYLDIALPQRGSTGLIEIIGSLFTILTKKEIELPAFSVTSTLPSIMNGGKDFCEWSKRDELLYATMRRPVETVLGKDGVALADCAICESMFEKGEDVSSRLLGLASRLGEVQLKGTPDIEFAIVGLIAREQVSQGRIDAARNTVLSLRERFVQSGQDRFLPNIDALLCRMYLRKNEDEQVGAWLREEAPTDILHLRALYRYAYLTLAQVRIARGEPEEALLTIAPLEPYCRTCARVMDLIHIKAIMAICHYRMNDASWVQEMDYVLDTCRSYHFVWAIAQYGVAILPLLTEREAKGDDAFFEEVVAATRRQAVLYPHFLERTLALVDPLSPAELQVLRLICHDMSNQEIGDLLGIKLPTVKTHVSHILQKLGVNRRAEAKALAEKLGLER